MLDLLSKTGKLGVKPCSFPMVLSVHLTTESETFEDPERYRRLVGKLNCLTVTRPNIAHSVRVVSPLSQGCKSVHLCSNGRPLGNC